MISKILLVTRREYLTRVRKKSFIVMTILAPLLMVMFYGVIIYFSVNKDIGETQKKIYVCDKTGLFTGKLPNNESFSFSYGIEIQENAQKKFLDNSDYFGILLISKTGDSLLPSARFMSDEQPAFSMVNTLQENINAVIRENALIQHGIDQKILDQINDQKITLITKKVTNDGLQSSNAGITTAIGFIGAFAIYMFIFLYGVQVMQGVIEEKTNRIVEVIISSVKPFQLMMGKIVGIAMVGLTQFVIWALLITVLGGSVSGIVMSRFGSHAVEVASQTGTGEIGDLFGALNDFNFTLIIGMFLFYFIGGYLFYGALFAAIGSAVDNETDKQQFMLPVTLPLVFAFVMSQSVIVSSPNSDLAIWLSLIPFTSPIAMMVRLPFGVPTWQLITSMVMMIGGFVFTCWLAGRIYRVGILMYGKKATYKELWKWLFYKA